MTDEQPKQRKIAIVGTAEPHWRGAPYGDESWEVWSLGGNFRAIPRWSRWFELHRPEDVCKGWANGDPQQEATARRTYTEWLAEQDGSNVFMQSKWPEVPDATVYPIDAIVKKFPNKYFTNSVSYMIAMALAEGCSELGLWGVDMALSSEYSAQRPSVEFFIGIAVGMGVVLHLPPDTSLLKSRELYAYEENSGFMEVVRAKEKEIEQRLALAKHNKLEATKGEAAMSACLEIVKFFGQNWEQ